MSVSTQSLDDLSFLSAYQVHPPHHAPHHLTPIQCVVVVDSSVALIARIDEFCRQQTPPVKFVCGLVRGVHGMVFTDFGSAFDVVDANGVT